jgi:hypothetical protein
VVGVTGPAIFVNGEHVGDGAPGMLSALEKMLGLEERRMEPTWDYECSICGELVAPEDISQHSLDHRAASDWPGSMTYRRVDRTPAEELSGGPSE